MRWLMQFVAAALLVAAGTMVAGWWTVPVLGALYGAWAAAQRTAVITAALAGAAGWGALLLWDATVGPVGRLVQVFGAFSHLPGSAFVVLTLAYPALLCASAAALSRGLLRWRAAA